MLATFMFVVLHLLMVYSARPETYPRNQDMPIHFYAFGRREQILWKILGKHFVISTTQFCIKFFKKEIFNYIFIFYKLQAKEGAVQGQLQWA